ncbi:MAG: hypothetical protein GWP16_05170 [Nitrospirae bacterium]|nr:hypothetical protein [Nitrospirota bacterium]
MTVRWDVGVWRATFSRSTTLKVVGFLVGEGLMGTLTTIARVNPSRVLSFHPPLT